MNDMNSNKPCAQQAAEDRGAATSEDLFRLHAQAVFAVCLSNTHNHHDADFDLSEKKQNIPIKPSPFNPPCFAASCRWPHYIAEEIERFR